MIRKQLKNHSIHSFFHHAEVWILKKACEKQSRFYLAGEMYKKNRFPDADPGLWDWLNRKSVCMCYDGTDTKELFSSKLFETVAQDYLILEPVYSLYTEMEARAAAK